MNLELGGIILALTILFTADGDVYEEGLWRLVQVQVEKGSHDLPTGGTHGSGPIMTIEQP